MTSKIGRFEIVGELGKGGMGIVFKAFDPLMYRHVAVKTLAAGVSSDPYARKRFLKEAVAAGRVSGTKSHPNIVSMYDLFEEGGQHYMVMEYVEGDSLRDVIAQDKPWSLEQKLAVTLQVCEALEHAHELGIVHRDIKPANILITPNQQVKLLDFGLAHLTASSFTMTHRGVGTPSYMAPEQWSGEEVDRRADVFSLAVTLYELVTKVKPFRGTNPAALGFQVLNKRVPPLNKVDPDLPAELADLVAKGMERDPKDRYPTAREFGDDLKRVLARVEELVQLLRHQLLQKAVSVDVLMAENRGELTEDALAPLVNEDLEVDRDLLNMLGIEAPSVASLPQLETMDYGAILKAHQRLDGQQERLRHILDQIRGLAPISRPEVPPPSSAASAADEAEVEVDIRESSQQSTSVTDILSDEDLVPPSTPPSASSDAGAPAEDFPLSASGTKPPPSAGPPLDRPRPSEAFRPKPTGATGERRMPGFRLPAGLSRLAVLIVVGSAGLAVLAGLAGWGRRMSSPTSAPVSVSTDVAAGDLVPPSPGSAVPASPQTLPDPELGEPQAPASVPETDAPSLDEPTGGDDRVVSLMTPIPDESGSGTDLETALRESETPEVSAQGMDEPSVPVEPAPSPGESEAASDAREEPPGRSESGVSTPTGVIAGGDGTPLEGGTEAVRPPDGAGRVAAEPSARQAIEETILAYAAGYETLDVAAVARVYPEIDTNGLSQAFAQLKSVRLEIAILEILVRSNQASARCSVRTLVEPAFGMAPPVTVSERLFEMEKRNELWVIASITDQ